MSLMSLLLSCSIPITVHPETLNALVKTESSYNPYAIAVVNGEALKSQPKNRGEAEAVIDNLEADNLNYSVGLGQVNKSNFKKYGVTGKDLLDSCTNIKISQKILTACYDNAPNKSVAEALSCYYAGNYTYGFVKEKRKGKDTAYIERVISNFQPIENMSVPSIKKEIPNAIAKVREQKNKKIISQMTVKDPVKVKSVKLNSPEIGTTQFSAKNKNKLIKNPPVLKPTSDEENNVNVTKTFVF